MALAILACLPALHGSARDTYDLHFYANSTAGGGWQAKRLCLAGEGSRIRIAAAAGTPVFKRSRQLVPVAIAGYVGDDSQTGAMPLARLGRCNEMRN